MCRPVKSEINFFRVRYFAETISTQARGLASGFLHGRARGLQSDPRRGRPLAERLPGDLGRDGESRLGPAQLRALPSRAVPFHPGRRAAGVLGRRVCGRANCSSCHGIDAEGGNSCAAASRCRRRNGGPLALERVDATRRADSRTRAQTGKVRPSRGPRHRPLRDILGAVVR